MRCIHRMLQATRPQALTQRPLQSLQRHTLSSQPLSMQRPSPSLLLVGAALARAAKRVCNRHNPPVRELAAHAFGFYMQVLQLAQHAAARVCTRHAPLSNFFLLHASRCYRKVSLCWSWAGCTVGPGSSGTGHHVAPCSGMPTLQATAAAQLPFYRAGIVELKLLWCCTHCHSTSNAAF